jgi:hypothetical protein
MVNGSRRSPASLRLTAHTMRRVGSRWSGGCCHSVRISRIGYPSVAKNLGLGFGGFLDQIDSGGGAGVLCDRSASITRILSANASASCKVLKSPMRFVPDGPVTLTWKPLGSVPVTS